MSFPENSKDTCLQVKAEPMEVDPPSEVAPPPSHLLGFSTLGACEKNEPMAGLPEPLPRPNKDLFSQDISVKMASELLFKLSGEWKRNKRRACIGCLATSGAQRSVLLFSPWLFSVCVCVHAPCPLSLVLHLFHSQTFWHKTHSLSHMLPLRISLFPSLPFLSASLAASSWQPREPLCPLCVMWHQVLERRSLGSVTQRAGHDRHPAGGRGGKQGFLLYSKDIYQELREACSMAE